MNCHILLTLLNPARLKAALLVFDSIRVGFPTANIIAYGNGIKDIQHRNLIERVAVKVGARYTNIPLHSHGQWIEKLLSNESKPFWICDTDIVFLSKVEDWFVDGTELYAGRYEPRFWESWTRTIHMARIHPSLVWFNAQPLRAAIRAWPGKHEFFNTVQTNLIQWSLVPEHGGDHRFYDTLAGLWHAMPGRVFSEMENQAFGHLFCGTYVDLVSDQHPNLAARHDAISENPELARELWKEQQEWYSQNAVKPNALHHAVPCGMAGIGN